MLETLKKARELIADPAHWCIGVNFRNEHDNACSREEATQYCAIGAVERVTYPDAPKPARCLHVYSKVFGEYSAQRVNDHCGHAAVMVLYDRAIDLLERWPHLEGAD